MIKMNKVQKIEQQIKQIKSHNLIILEGAISVLSALSSNYAKVSKVILRSDDKNRDKDNRNIQKIINTAKQKNVGTDYFSPAEFEEFSALYDIGKTHGGIIALTEKRKYLPAAELILLYGARTTVAIGIIEGVEDPYNLGYAVRALYTQGVAGLILPERDFGFSESVIEKASTGTFSKMPIAVFTGIAEADNSKTELIRLLKDNYFKIYCIDKKAPPDLKDKIPVSDIFDVKFADRTVFIIGGEKRGISKDFLNNADEIVRIPYASSFSHSLAAQTAATIVAYEIHRQRR